MKILKKESIEILHPFSHKKTDSVINVKVEFGKGKRKAALDVIAEVKRSLGLLMYDAPNAVEELKQPRKHPPKEKAEAIKTALKYFEVI